MRQQVGAAHCSDEILRERARNVVLLLNYPRHMSHVFQVIDVLRFGRLKMSKKYLPKDDDENREIDHILRIFRAYNGVTIRGSWNKAGYGHHRRDGTFYLAADEAKIRTFLKFGRGII
jgi:hypothetical protein